MVKTQRTSRRQRVFRSAIGNLRCNPSSADCPSFEFLSAYNQYQSPTSRRARQALPRLLFPFAGASRFELPTHWTHRSCQGSGYDAACKTSQHGDRRAGSNCYYVNARTANADLLRVAGESDSWRGGVGVRGMLLPEADVTTVFLFRIRVRDMFRPSRIILLTHEKTTY